MEPAEEALRAQIADAFGEVSAAPAEELLSSAYASTDDAYEMMEAFRDQHWTEIPIADLFRHREMLIALSGIGFRAYLPAYLTACLTDSERYGADLRGYMLFGLRPLSESELHVTTSRERLSLLDKAQRAAVASVLRYLESRWKMKEAGEILHAWE
jgi:hypothetical protein